jgi:hypothetical protein
MSDSEPWSIVLDCPPGAPRPSDVLLPVLRGAGLSLDDFGEPDCSFGEWTYTMDPAKTHLATPERVLAVGRGLVELYNRGVVRYASW